MKEIFFLEWFVEVEFDSLFSLFDQFHLLLSLLGSKSNFHQLLSTPLEITQLDALVRQWVVDVPNVRVSTWISNTNG